MKGARWECEREGEGEKRMEELKWRKRRTCLPWRVGGRKCICKRKERKREKKMFCARRGGRFLKGKRENDA